MWFAWLKDNDPDFIYHAAFKYPNLVSTYQTNNNLYGGAYSGKQNYFVNLRNGLGQSIYDQIITFFLGQSSLYIDSMNLSEWHIYGSNRLGIYQTSINMAYINVRIINNVTSNESTETTPTVAMPSYTVFDLERGAKKYELTNHLGNVLVVVSDKKIQVCSTSTVSYVIADVVSATDYSPGGVPLSNRNFTAPNVNYRFGFNKGSEKDDEISVLGGHFTTLFREGDTRLLTWWGIDPEADEQPYQSPYSYMDGNPILLNDPNGDCPWCVGALIGGGVELGTQMLGNYFAGEDVYKIDWKAVGVSTLEGALTAGASAGRSLAVRATSAVVKSSIEYSKTNDIKTLSDGVNIFKNAAIDLAVDKAAGGVSNFVAGKFLKQSLNKVANKTIISKTTATKIVQKAKEVSTKEARTISKNFGLRDGTKQIAKEIRNAPKTLVSAVVKGKTNEYVKTVKNKTDIKQ